jgi:hypothetical protein
MRSAVVAVALVAVLGCSGCSSGAGATPACKSAMSGLSKDASSQVLVDTIAHCSDANDWIRATSDAFGWRSDDAASRLRAICFATNPQATITLGDPPRVSQVRSPVCALPTE